jgi:hypothetical protein
MNQFNKHSFENFIAQCCKSREWDLRTFLKRVLSKAGFTIQEDDYKTHRGPQYNNVHNMLAIRGKPRVCLVAHTDVCRDHAYGSPNVDPIIKTHSIQGEIRSIIQDRYCNVQVGGDDRLGVAINTWIALNTGYDLALLFTTDEEVGLVSAEQVKFPELLEFDILLQVDRGNHSDQLVTTIGGCQLCSEITARRLLKISEDINLPRYRVNGMMTDVLAIKTNHMCNDAVNMTCGYHNSIGADQDEYIDIQESKDTVKYVSNIIKYYYLNEDKNENVEPDYEEEHIEYENVYPINQASENRHDNKLNRRSRRKRVYEGLWSEQSYRKSRDEAAYFDEEGYRGGWPRNLY